MEHGTVTTSTYDEGVVYCNVQAIREDVEYQNVPVLKPHSGFIQMPEQDETVTMLQLNDGTRFINQVVSTDDGTPDGMREGELAIQLDADTRLRFKEQNDGTYSVLVGASGDLSVQVEGDLDISATGEVNLDSDASIVIDGTPFSDHVHEYTDNGTASNTGPPK